MIKEYEDALAFTFFFSVSFRRLAWWRGLISEVGRIALLVREI